MSEKSEHVIRREHYVSGYEQGQQDMLQLIIDNLILLGALRPSFAHVGPDHYCLFSKHGQLDIIPDDLTKELDNEQRATVDASRNVLHLLSNPR